MTDTQGGSGSSSSSNASTEPNGRTAERRSYDRRRYLQLMGAAGLLSVGSIPTTASASDQSGEGWIVEVPDEDDWEDAADERIRDHRTADLTLEVTNTEGELVPDADVTVEQVEHAYGFGTAVNAETLINESEAGDEYREYIPELFNKAVMENRHKWRFFEEQQELADDATDWILEQGLDLRGHACLWANRDVYAVPADIEEAMDDDDAEYVRERSLEHIETIIDHYGDDIEEWDVVNEAVHEAGFTRLIEGPNASPVESPILAEWYRAAETATPDGVSIAVNDYNVLVGPDASTRNLYERQVEYLLEEEIDLGGIGLQSHFSAGSQLSPRQTIQGLNRYAEYGVPIRITEFDMAGSSWDEADKAEFFRGFLKTVFSHPATEDFMMWGFWDGRHWENDAPLFTDDWSEKPTYEVYTELVFEEWWTDESGMTDSDGQYTTSGFMGEYEITASREGESETTTATLTEGGATVEFTLDVDAEPIESETIPGFGVATGLAGVAGGAAYALSRRAEHRPERRTERQTKRQADGHLESKSDTRGNETE